MSGFNLARFNPFLYRSYIYDYETGLYYLQSRYYDPEIGRFINADEPVFTGNGHNNIHNAYAYCNDNPVNSIDPSGYIGYLFTLIDPWAFTISLTISLISLWAADGLIESLSSIPFGGYRRQTLDLPLDRIYDLANVTTIPYQENPVVPLPKVESPAISISSSNVIEAEEADKQIRRLVRKNSTTRYWAAWRIGGVVIITQPLIYPYAVVRVINGLDVFTVTRSEAKQLAKAAGGHTKPIYHMSHDKGDGYNYYYHYHVFSHNKNHQKNGNRAHIYYLF